MSQARTQVHTLTRFALIASTLLAACAPSAPQVVTLAAGQHATNVNFGLAPITEYSYCASPNLNIPDNNPTGVSTQLMVTDGDILAGITCSVNVTHTWKGDLVLELTSPLGTTVRLHNRTGGSTDNIVAHYLSLIHI